jgi:hypothetical protein
MSALKNTPPMVVTTDREGDVITLKVEHADHQSYSRAVDPRATRSMKAYMSQHRLRHVALVDAKYGVTDPAPRRTVSVFTYHVKEQ